MISRICKKIFLIFLLSIPVIYILLDVFVAYSRFEHDELDWNQDGIIQLSEIFQGAEIIKFSKKTDELICVYYVYSKDGLPVKEVCNPTRAE